MERPGSDDHSEFRMRDGDGRNAGELGVLWHEDTARSRAARCGQSTFALGECNLSRPCGFQSRDPANLTILIAPDFSCHEIGNLRYFHLHVTLSVPQIFN